MRWCPGWDSNPHWTVFETAFSADWNTGAGNVAPYRADCCGRGRPVAGAHRRLP